MIIYYNADNGKVNSIFDGFTHHKSPLEPGEAFILMPDHKALYNYLHTVDEDGGGSERLSIVNGNILLDGASFFTFSGVRDYYRELLDEMFANKLNLFGLTQLWKIQVLRQMFDNGTPITYPQNFYNINTGALVEVPNAAGLANAENYLLGVALTHLNSRIAKYASIKQVIESAETIGDLTAINFTS